MTDQTHPRPICFLVMPFGVKETGRNEYGVPASIDFDALWNRAFYPLLHDLGYDPVRADQDTGASIIGEMIERLALSDLIVADITLPNPNVFYEIGVRHAARSTGCVLVAADWARPPFDVAQMRRLVYPLPPLPDEPLVQDDLYAGVCVALKPNIVKHSASTTPCHEHAGFPQLGSRAVTFRKHFKSLQVFQDKVRRAHLEDDAAERSTLIRKLVEPELPATLQCGAAMELIGLIRDSGEGFRGVVDFVGRLPPAVRDDERIEEQRVLALAKTGAVVDAIVALTGLIDRCGATAERLGLLGGRHKQMYRAAKTRGDETTASRERALAIECYRRGMLLDLNGYYCACNLPGLLRARAGPGDFAEAIRVGHAVALACERARHLKIADEWLLPTLLGSAFDSGDATAAERLLEEITMLNRDERAKWKVATTLANARDSIAHLSDQPTVDQLLAVAKRLEELG